MLPPTSKMDWIQEPLSLYLHDGSRYELSHDSGNKHKIVVNGNFPDCQNSIVETVRHPENSKLLMFLSWHNGCATVSREIELDGQIFVPADPTDRSFPCLTIPDGLLQCGTPGEMLVEICSTISQFIKLQQDHLLVVARL